MLTLGGDALLLQSFLLLAKRSPLLSDFGKPAFGTAKLRGERLHVARTEGFEGFALRAGLLLPAADGLPPLEPDGSTAKWFSAWRRLF